MGFSPGHNLALSDKMRQLQAQKKREHDVLAGKSQPAAMHHPLAKRNPRHLDLMEAASQRQRSIRRARNDDAGQQTGTGKENLPVDTKKPQHLNDLSYRQIAYDQYLEDAFGLNSDQRPKPAAIQRLRPADSSMIRPESDVSARSDDSMEVNFHMASKDTPSSMTLSAKDRRPKIQVTIPGKQQTPSSRHLIHQLNRQKTTGRARDRQSDVSPPSSTQSRGHSEAPARLSIVSPLSVVEMPRPRRPFSALSLEDMTHDMPSHEATLRLSHEKSSSSDSDSTKDGDRSSNYSPQSSLSSLSEDATRKPKEDSHRHSVAFSIINPATAGVFDNLPLMPRKPKGLRIARSNTSLAPNTNKPLPPEPGMEDVAPLKLPGQSYHRGSLHSKRKAPTPLTISRASTADATSTRAPSRMSSLRSKYTPADLDALDAAFVSSSPGPLLHKQKSLEQAEQELEAHLGTIEEDEGGISIPLMHEPLQISRGPNQMVPSRQAPPPPSSSASIKLSDGSTSNRSRLRKKPSIHVALQMRTELGKEGSDLRKRISAPFGGSAKAHRILGRPEPYEHATPMQREASSESNWSSSESPEASYAATSSPEMMARDLSGTPETDVSSMPDPAFEEVKARLELLSPKNDAHSYMSCIEDERAKFEAQANDTTKSSPRLHVSSESQSDIPIRFNEIGNATVGKDQERRGRTFQDDARSLASIAMSEIPDLYAELPPPLPSPIPATKEYRTRDVYEAETMISADAAEQVLLHILQNLDNLQDLFATATVSRGFYRTFKRHELPLMKNALYGMSPAAWELREMCSPLVESEAGDVSPTLGALTGYTPTSYLQHYMRDMYTMIALKSMILIHCESFLRTDTITALAGGETERASQIDDAFWRVWTFCHIFGCGSNREHDIATQMDWLRGGVQAGYQSRGTGDAGTPGPESMASFGRGNAGGLSASELYDMTEIWTCLGVLVRGFQGKRQEAREFGVFDSADVSPGDIEAEDRVLEEWTYHLLTLAPPTVLDVTSPTSPTAATFAHARSKGYTTWSPPIDSRATFLKEAVSRVYQEKIAEERPGSVPTSPHANLITPAGHFSSNPEEAALNESIAARWRCARHAAEIRAKRNDPAFKALPPSEERPMSEYPDVLARLNSRATSPPPPLPTHRATPSETDTAKHMVSALVVPAGPQVRDPVDVAVDKLVAMGFEASKAKRALADTDTGNNVDFDSALEYLVRERKRDVNGIMHAGYRGKAEHRVVNAGSLVHGDEIASPVHTESGVGLGLSGLGRCT